MTLRVRDLMRTNLITCPPGTSLGAAAALLARHRVHAIVVADSSGLQQGIVSDIDLLAGEWLAPDAASQASMRALTAGQIMSTPVATIDAEASATAAAARMRAERIHRLVVTEMERGIGVISISDLVASLSPSVMARRLVADVMSRGMVVCRADTTIAAAARAMTDRRSRSLLVADAVGQPLGIVTGYDLLAFVGESPDATTVSAVMHSPITISHQASVRAAVESMLARHIHQLVVVDPAKPEGLPLGLISTADIVAEMAAPNALPR